MLNKKLFAGAVLAFAVFALTATTVSAATVRVGSKGADVITVQTAVGVTPDGSFGPKTKAAVVAFQTAHNLPADGVVGPMTWAAITAAGAGAGTGNLPSGCTAGAMFSSTTGVACTVVTNLPAGCTAGAMFSSTTGMSCTGGSSPVMTGTTDGSISPQSSSYVSSGIQIKKGETKDVAAVRLQASVGPVKVTRVDVHFDVRPWLFFSTVALHDNTGKVLATKTLSSVSDVTEIGVGTDYQVRFDGLNYVVAPGTNPDLAVSATVLSATDKIPGGGQTVNVSINGIKTMSEIGYSETLTAPTVFTSGIGYNQVSLTSTGSVAALYTRISPSSPAAGQQVVSATQVTNDVVLGAFSIKSTNNTSTLNTLKVALTGTAANFSNYRLYVGGSSVAGGTFSTPTITFSNLTVPLALDAWTDFVVKADVKSAPTMDADVHLTLTSDTTNIVVTDANYGTATVTAGTRATNAITLTANSVAVSGTSAILGAAIVQSQVTTGYNATYKLTLTNNSNNDLYVGSTPSTFVTATTAGSTGTTTNTALTSVTVDPSTVNGDDTYTYAIPAGSARTFTFSAVLKGTANTIFKATALNYSTAAYTNATTTAGTPGSISTGLSSLSLTASF